MWLIVGLGNPGNEYAGNRHNIGFMAVDRMADDHGFGDWQNKFSAHVCDGRIGTQKVMLMKPQTFMNESGVAVAKAANFYKLSVDQIIVLYDELDLPLGKVRHKIGGGAAGHNGIRSIDMRTGEKDYHRIRVGIGHPGKKSMVSSYVLSDFDDDEHHKTDDIVRALSRHIDRMLGGNTANFMTQVAENLKGLEEEK